MAMRFSWPQTVTDSQDKDFLYELSARLAVDDPSRETRKDRQRAKLHKLLRD